MIAKTRSLHQKNITDVLPVEECANPPFIYLAVTNARCPEGQVFIKEGDHVNRCEVIGMRKGPFFEQPIHATVSGTFVGIEKHEHRSGKIVDFIKIQNDFLDTFDPSVKMRSDSEIARLTKEEMTEIIKQNACVGLGGSSFPTYIKFQTNEKINTILINGIECEPFISADHRMLLEHPHRIVKGIQYIMQAFDCKNAIICVKKKYKDILKLYEYYLKPYPGITIKGVGNYYPQGWELEMIKSAMGVKVPQGTLPAKYGIINFNASTVAGIYFAIKFNRTICRRNITISGDGIKQPFNMHAVVGTPVKDLLPLCGGYVDNGKPKVFILGGPMMGASVPSDDCIITKTVTSVIVLDKKEWTEEPCVRCGSCSYSCPVHLQPVRIMKAFKAKDLDELKLYDINKCIECGMCSFTCTSKIPLTDYMRKAKIIARTWKS